MYAIEVTGVRKEYSGVTALDGLSLAVESGTTFGLLGTNGAGKSTLFKLLVGHIRPDDGTVSVAGTDVSTAGPELRSIVGYLPEHAGFPASLTGREILSFHARMHNLPEAENRIETVLDVVGLSDAADRRVGGYSNGMTRRLGLAAALLSQPRILLLDEPTAGLDPRGVAAFHRVIERLDAKPDLTVVVSSHVLSEIESLCERVAILHDGQLRASGTIDELRRQVTDEARVRIRLGDGASIDDIQSVVSARGGTVQSTDYDGHGVVIDCYPDEIPALLSDLTEAVPIDGYDVREPGLERVFEQTLRESEEGPDSDQEDTGAEQPRELAGEHA
ncbi:ABC transporter ATP-binding protein (plasmid) [Haloferax mediterranei ATCC 33500]|uniref:ABC transporter ATP-binding protein n=1 Tax=Haloferax mediterranei (strain ATCC 33500 / DSM 1411 / JCM 8866 / NBRC 14739 / NCIMB 2177 / R-4) TaxID=523841 RepID=I3R9L3_HALMT|nr:ABC transporter ATP-binding protein [Haloferax mediterranei]AFK20923.1 ABC transporter ATP-binding protein [Haloferax mediterranei ATCC 33500]AHZ24208.1 ABC transporter ATP-binding protein [Haloferax mediterranei ATCC 33500]EMA05287.1 ABC transporter ATP-binding protein [Haloferax mediterranei ATCC 33500]MDX5989911.1 ABC transporter ATP-binding protein [Haloferax mediterranei ATCC 33500]QCQ77352.1 ABC transporter ATP-binding protein [Haloferax mediterranei ATCC 33500]